MNAAFCSDAPAFRAGPPHCGVKGDSWFGSVKTCYALHSRGIKGVFQVKTRHKGYPKVFIEDAMKGMPGGMHLVMNGVNRVTGEKLVAVAYWYSTQKTLSFIMTPGAGTTRKGTPYEMKYATDCDNVGGQFVDHLEVLSKFFEESNCVDRHNQARQFELHLEKCWATMDPAEH